MRAGAFHNQFNSTLVVIMFMPHMTVLSLYNDALITGEGSHRLSKPLN